MTPISANNAEPTSGIAYRLGHLWHAAQQTERILLLASHRVELGHNIALRVDVDFFMQVRLPTWADR